MAAPHPITPGEVWYPIPSWPGYEFSSEWRLRSTATPGGPPRTCIKKFTLVRKTGYLVTCLWRDGRKYTVCLHKIITDLIYGPTPDGMVVRHFNDDSSNNFPSNLTFGTQADNVRDAIRNKRFPTGDACPWAKLTDDAVRDIRAAIAAGEMQSRIARRYGVHPCVVSEIKTGRKWKHLA